MAQLLSDSGAGLLVDPDDAGGLAAALVKVLTDPELRAGLSERGRAAAASYRWARTLAPVLDFAAAPAFDPHRTVAGSAPANAPRGWIERLAEALARRRSR